MRDGSASTAAETFCVVLLKNLWRKQLCACFDHNTGPTLRNVMCYVPEKSIEEHNGMCLKYSLDNRAQEKAWMQVVWVTVLVDNRSKQRQTNTM